MTDDKRDGDDLFEDLDKFFAPINDVDWDEPADTVTTQASREEHVAVRAKDPSPPAETTQDLPAASEPLAGDAEEAAQQDEAQVEAPEEAPEGAPEEAEEEAWYDTGLMDTVQDAPDSESLTVLDSGFDQDPELEHDVVRIVDEGADPGRYGGDTPQADLFTQTGPDQTEVGASEWSPVEDARLDTATTPDSREEVDETVIDQEPSEEELAAATAHFADSVSREARVSPFGDEEETLAADGSEIGGDTHPHDGDEDDADALAGFGGSEPRQVAIGSEGYGGPSWQEPASMEVGSDAHRRGPDRGERDVPAAFLTGVVLAGVALGALLIGKGVFALVATVVVVWAQGELYGVMVKHRYQPATAVGLAAGALMMAGAYLHGEGALLAMFSLGTVATFLWFMAVPSSHRKNTVVNIGLTLLSMAWIPLLAGFLLIVLASSDGTALVVTVIGLTFIFDTTAFLGGSVFGGQWFRRGLAPATSPKKSVEGLLMATAAVALAGAALVPAFVTSFDGKRIDALLLALVVAAAATFGDLAESLIKRDLQVKDMGSVLPGHGGVLDRIDSLLFVAPAAFLFFRILFG